MKNFKKILKRVGIVMIFSVLLSGFIYLIPYALAVSPEKGNFVTLGRAENEQLIDEKIDLRVSPGICDVIMAKVKSGTAVLVLDKKTVELKNFYIVSTVGKDGGMMGWVSEEYIYEILPEPLKE